ncbi:hypothetical protein BDA99DRAFT_606288 [Phascolomyces articulosus]|uniref:Uncharacterized protein n=1 Tax=Phascolomyces articulosus TaxID=60185 RepID=A0AAD5K9W6_9FUNG|nr:hypothetical protein BDA99DRAFT_606288 [Phascolomyces articulosus]
MDNNNRSLHRSFAEIQQRTNILTDSMEVCKEFHEQYNNVMVNNVFADWTREDKARFLISKEEYHDFEHFLRIMKYELAIEKYHIRADHHQQQHPFSDDPNGVLSIQVIEVLERMIHNYLLSHTQAWCRIHTNRDAAEENMLIKTEIDLEVVQMDHTRETEFRQVHVRRSENYERNLLRPN